MCRGRARVSGSSAVSWLIAACGQIFCFCKRQMNPLGVPWCHVMNAANIQFNVFMAGVDIPKLPSWPAATNLLPPERLSAVSGRWRSAAEPMGSKCRHNFSRPIVKSVQVFLMSLRPLRPDFQAVLPEHGVTAWPLQPSPTQFAQHRLLFLSKQKGRKLPKFLGEPVKTYLTSSQLMGTVKYLC